MEDTMNLNTPEVAEAAVETSVDEEAAFANTAEEVAANPDFVAADTASNEEDGDAKTEAVDEDAPEENAEAAHERRLPKLGRYVDSGNDLIEAQMPDMVQASDEDEMRRAIRQHRVLYAKVVAIEPMGDGIKIVAKRNTMRVVFVPEDFFKYSLMKDMLLGDINNAIAELEKLEYPTPTRMAQEKNLPVEAKMFNHGGRRKTVKK